MPSTLPSTFASAAAGITNEVSSSRSSSRPDGVGSSDRQKRSNGATQTFRRTSHVNTSMTLPQQAHSNTQPIEQNAPSAYPQVSTQGRNGYIGETRYSKTQLLDLFRALQSTSDLRFGLADLAVGDLDSGGGHGTASTRWGRRDESSSDGGNVEICGVPNGSSIPSGLVDLTDEEKLIFATSVNSPLKPPNSGLNKDGTQREAQPSRKASMSQGNGSGAFGLTSPIAKSANRRRDVSDAFPFPREMIASPSTANKFAREDLTTSRSTGFRQRVDKDPTEGPTDEDENVPHSFVSGQPNSSPFATLKRTMTGPVHHTLSDSTSPWVNAPQSAGLTSLGSLGNFAIGAGPSGSSTVEKRPNLTAHRMESRFRSLMTKDHPGDLSKDMKAKNSSSSLGRADSKNLDSETTEEPAQPLETFRLDNADYYPEDEVGFGSAALGGGYDTSPNDNRGVNAFGTPLRQRLGVFGLPQSESHAFKDPNERRFGDPYGSFYASSGNAGEEPMSPTYTNPYQSPDQRTSTYPDAEMRGPGVPESHLPGLGGFSGQHASNAQNESRGADRAQTSSTGPGRGFPALSGLGTLAGLSGSGPWSALPASANAGRERLFFPDSLNDPLTRSSGDLNSSSINKTGPGSSNAAGRGSRMGSLFPLAMQEQMRGSEIPRRMAEDLDIDSRDNDSGTIGSRAFSSTVSLGRTGSDNFTANEASRTLAGPELQTYRADVQAPQKGSSYSPGSMLSPQATGNQSGLAHLSGSINQSAGVQHPTLNSETSLNQPPTAQQKTMVMPDRIRWIYRDPQGNTQGPWSGLEMHDWYKAGFFSPELLVKKVEDADYEPLAQLIRRIGNSREPFLVPQIGIPGPPNSQSVGWPNPTTSSSSGHASTAMQPPFASSFPSFGTTLTADQQNALERRKQEEQYLMARQKEHLAQQQVLAKQMQLQGSHAIHSQQVHHHPSAHTLQSPQGLTALSSSNGYPQSHAQMPGLANQMQPGLYDSSFRPGAGPITGASESLGNIHEDGAGHFGSLSLGQLQLSDDASQLEPTEKMDSKSADARISLALSDREQLRTEQALHEIPTDEARFHQDRLHQFQTLSVDKGDESFELGDQRHNIEQSDTPSTRHETTNLTSGGLQNDELDAPTEQHLTLDDPQITRNLSLTEQVQQAASAKQQLNRQTTQTAWTKVDAGLPQQLPPPPSSSPLPAPAAQRNRQHVADVLTAESLSQGATSVEGSNVSLAPWAKEVSESQKQPSLKEIQEAEAKKAAKREEIASAARRAALERELLAQPSIQTSGLPSSSTWGNGESPAINSAAASVWAKSSSGASTATTNTQAKKTLQQIQKEEEALAKRQKVLANNGTASSSSIGSLPTTSSGKRYADLASKAAVPAAIGGGAWTTVGNGGKVKPPARSAPSPTSRSVSASAVPAASTPSRTKPTTASTKSSSLLAAQQNAHEQLKKWATVELRPDLNKGIQVEDFIQGLFSLPSEVEIITEAVHGVSQTMDSRHFAEELVRRRKLADKGMVDSSGIGSAATHNIDAKTGGWSEVAKKGPSAPSKEDTNAFKVVATKRKTGKK